MNKVEIHVCLDEAESWDVLWRWLWFTRKVWEPDYWIREEEALKPVLHLLAEFDVKSVLDCSCGLGYKTVLFAKAGYSVEGSDASAVAIKYAPILAEENGVKIRFFHSRYEELSEKCRRTYDCVWSDNFDEISTYGYLRTAAKSIYSILNRCGILVFMGSPGEDLRKIIEEEWGRRERFYIDPPFKEGSVRVTRIEVAEKTAEGILEHNIFLIEEGGRLRAEIASLMNPRIKWAFRDFKEVLEEAGFREVYMTKENCVVAVK